MVARLLAALLLLVSVLTPSFAVRAPSAEACTCLTPRDGGSTRQEKLIAADIVATGTVKSYRLIDVTEQFALEYEILIAVDEYIKGSGRPVIAVRDTGSSCSLLRQDDVGEAHVLVLTRWQGALRTGSCSGSHRITELDDTEAQRGVAVLREELGEHANALVEPDAAPDWPIPLGTASGGLALAALVFILWRGFRHG
jgi:hypothetical protein